MGKKYRIVNKLSAVVYGAESEKVFLFVHGQDGNKEEAESFAEKVAADGWQVISIDLPEHGERKLEDGFVPWVIIPELQDVFHYAQSRWKKVALRANSIGAWFSMLALADAELSQTLLVSPILDMKQLIENMMTWAGVSEERLENERVIQTDFGQELSWDYLTFARQHPISKWLSPTAILYGEKDDLTERAVVENFASTFKCQLKVMEEGEHWFHTPEQLEVMNDWLSEIMQRKE